ncbi:Hypothetical predicted protein [Marmota monax]|uniref:Uncharacterized protein n=1 Tax=Marmota monax TaxID=9995 RepID=A0A5E4AT08_MARMO|nr:Hypothetical predicted protein [Marmota monax]
MFRVHFEESDGTFKEVLDQNRRERSEYSRERRKRRTKIHYDEMSRDMSMDGRNMEKKKKKFLNVMTLTWVPFRW